MTYTELVASIKAYTQNTETAFVAEIPGFVKQAEDRIQHMVQLPAFRKTSTGTTTADNRFLNTPSDFVSVYALAVIAALLYGALVEAYTFMKGETDMLQLYDKRYMEALVKLKELGDGKNRQDMYRSGQTRMAVG